MNTAEYLNTLIECKEDMKSAIEERWATVTGGLSTYADLIREIEWDFRHIEVIYVPNGVNIGTYYSTTPDKNRFVNIAFDITDNPDFILDVEYPYSSGYKVKEYNVDGKKIVLLKYL